MERKRKFFDPFEWGAKALFSAAAVLALIGLGVFVFQPASAALKPTSPAVSETVPLQTQTETQAPATSVETPAAPDEASSTTLAPTETPVPAVTPTPTATALPMIVKGNPLDAVAHAPAPQANAPCGIVDVLDFPLDPPDGDRAYGGDDFGQHRPEYGGYHTGEDWAFRSDGSSLSRAVYSIGHGQVTYAQPLGWGQDQGVVIVQHTFSDGATILSLYGHLDPESVQLQGGQCVVRGDMVGRIGQPTTPPHLHFELRTHMPTEPGPGYSAQDPTQLGWRSPSAFIWQQRLAASPGVLWTRPPVDNKTKSVGLLDENTYLILQTDDLVAIDVRDGNVRWQYTPTIRPYSALIHPHDKTLYVASVFGVVQALRTRADWTDPQETPLEFAWELDLDATTYPDLMPLPGGGIVLSTRREMVGLSTTGARLWEADAPPWSSNWILGDGRLIVSGIGGDIWTLSQEGPAVLGTTIGGRLARVAQDQVLTYGEQGIHRLDLNTRATALLYPLPGGLSRYSDLAVLQAENDDILVTHRDTGGDSLTALAPDGTVRWRRSYEYALREQRSLLAFDGHAYLVSETQGLTSNKLSLYAIDAQNAELLRIFMGGSRSSATTNTWLAPIGHGRLLIHIGDTALLALDTQAAHTAAQDR